MKQFKNKKILITGGLGFIGSNLALRLLSLGACVTVVDSLIPQYGGNLFNIKGIEDRIRVNISDVRDVHSMPFLVKGKDWLFNLAGQTSHMDSMREPFTDLDINSRAQLAILETCRHHNPQVKIVFASTRQIYGKPGYLPVDEKHPLDPVDINGINKLAGEGYHLLYHKVYGIRSVVLRLTNTFGPRMRIKDSRQTFLGTWIRQLLQHEPLEVWGGDQLRDFTYVDDCVDAMLMTALDKRADGKVFNLGGDDIVDLKHLADILTSLDASGSYRIHPFPEDRKKIDIGDYYSDYTRIHAALSWKPKISLREGLKRTVDYYRTHLKEYL